MIKPFLVAVEAAAELMSISRRLCKQRHTPSGHMCF